MRNLIEEGRLPDFYTKRGKLLFIDKTHYDAYSSASGAKILIDVRGRFWGYSDDPRLKEVLG